MRTLAVTTLILCTFGALLAAQPKHEPPRPLAPTQVTWQEQGTFLGKAKDTFPKQAGVEVSVSPGVIKAKLDADFKNTPFWEALQTSADRTGAQIALHSGGRKVELVPKGKSRESASTSGSFRVVSQSVVGKAILEQGTTFHEVQMLVHWEPRLRVYRIDTTPQISKVSDVPGSKIVAEVGGTQVLPADATSEMKVKLTGLTRDSDRITTLAGTFTVTAADKMLMFDYSAPNGKLPEAQKKDGVSAALKRVQNKGGTWEIAIEVTYPEKQPNFESFQGEWWLRDNRLTVVSPQGKSFVIDDFETPTPDNPRPLLVIHRFKENAATGLGNPTQPNWKIVYETPAPLTEVKMPFELKDIPLP